MGANLIQKNNKEQKAKAKQETVSDIKSRLKPTKLDGLGNQIFLSKSTPY